MTIPKSLYHYTSQKGLLGILQTNKLWMTDILYLNDSSEFKHTLGLIKLDLEKRKKQLPPLRGFLNSTNTQEDDIINNTHYTFEKIKTFCEGIGDITQERRFEHFVFSLSHKEDDLSQWRSYCPKEGGFSIEFDYEKLLPLIQKYEGYKIEKCIYDQEEKQKLINSLLDNIYTKFESDKDLSINVVVIDIFIRTIFLSSYIKDESFKNEKEYRIINYGSNKGKIDHCEGKSMIIPHIELSPVDNDKKLPISKIWVGPTPHPELSKFSIEGLLRSKGYKDVKVEKSKIPYRSW